MESHRGVWSIVTLLIVVGVYAYGAAAPFELQDDHRIIAPALAPHPGAVRMWVDALKLDVTEVGRFRVVNQIFDVIGPVVLGPSPAVWHGLLLAITAVVTLLLYFAGAIAWRSPLAGAVFALVTMLAPDPGPTTTWYRLGPKEGWAMVFVAAALLLMAVHAGKNGFGAELAIFVLLLLSAFSKEPFVLLVPAFFGVRVWLEARERNATLREAFRSLRGVSIAYGALFVAGLAGIAYVVRSAGAHSYGAKSLGMSFSTIARVLLRDVLRAPGLAIWFVPALLVLVLYPRRVDLFGLLVALAWIAPQYAMYGTRGGFWDHYWIPCVVGFAAINAAAMTVLAGKARWVAVIATILWIVNAMRIDAFAVRNFVKRANVQQTAARIAAAHSDPRKALVIVSNYADDSERADAFADFVRFDGGKYARVVMSDPASRVPSGAGAAVFLAPSSWYPPDMLLDMVAADQLHFSLRSRRITREPFVITVAEPHP